MAKVSSVRGLQNYIKEIRACTTKEAEKERVDKELGKIRKKYTSDRKMRSYDRRKYMWKLLYTHMLGYDVDFGHKQAMDLMAAPAYAEKQVGYVVCSLLLNEKDDLLRMVINTVRNDLLSRNEAFQCLALDFAANVGGAEFAGLLTGDVAAVLSNGATRPAARRKAALCLLRLLRKAPADANVFPAETWGVRLAAMLEERDLGVQLGLTTLLVGAVARDYRGFEPCVPRLVSALARCVARDVPQDYTYYGLASPWLQVRALRALQYLPPPADPAVRAELARCVGACLAAHEPARNANKANAVHAIALEAAPLAVAGDDPELLSGGVALLARFLGAREPNLRCLALASLARLASSPGVPEAAARHAGLVRACLSDPDASVARSALDLLFALCTRATARDLVGALLDALPGAEPGLRADLVLRAAALAERFMPDGAWFVDVALALLAGAGDDAPADLWHSLVHVATNGDDALHARAAASAAAWLATDRPLPDALLKPAVHLLGEYAGTAATPEAYSEAARDVVARRPSADPRLSPSAPPDPLPPAEALRLISARLPGAGDEVRALALTAARRLAARDPADQPLQVSARAILEAASRSRDPDLQQRACEYLRLPPTASGAAMAALPPWEERGSLLLRRIAQSQAADADEDAGNVPAWAADAVAQAQAAAHKPRGPGVVLGQPVPEAATGPGQGHETAKGGEGNDAAAAASQAPAQEASDLLDLLDLSGDSKTTPAGPGTPGPAAYGADGAGTAQGNALDPFAASSGAPAPAYGAGYAAAARAPGAAAAVDPFAASSGAPAPASAPAPAPASAPAPAPASAPAPVQATSSAASLDPFAASSAAYARPGAVRSGSFGPSHGPPSAQSSGAAGALAPGIGPGTAQGAVAPDAAASGPAAVASPAPAPPAAPSPAPSLPAPAPAGDVASWLARLRAGSSGVLYEDAQLQVGVRFQPASGASVAFSIFFGNKSGETLHAFAAEVRPPPGLSVALSGAGAPAEVEAGRQARVDYAATFAQGGALSPEPALRLAYVSSTHRLDATLTLPLHVGKAAVPADVPPTVFASRWAQVRGPPHKLRARVAIPARAAATLPALSFLKPIPLDAAEAAEAQVAAHAAAADPFAAAPAPPTQAACVVPLQTQEGQPPRQVPCMVRVEPDAQDGELAVAAADPAVAQAILQTLQELL